MSVKTNFSKWKAKHKAIEKAKRIDNTIKGLYSRITDGNFTELEQVAILKEVNRKFKKQKSKNCNRYRKQAKELSEALNKM